MLDFLAAMVMLFPALFVLVNQPIDFQPDVAYRYAMGMGAPLMISWTLLLIWADQRPVERKGILPITLLVVIGEVVVQIWGILNGFLPFSALRLTFGMQVVLIALFLFSYFNARDQL
jgi:hypothetical protein